MKLRLY